MYIGRTVIPLILLSMAVPQWYQYATLLIDLPQVRNIVAILMIDCVYILILLFVIDCQKEEPVKLYKFSDVHQSSYVAAVL